MDLSKLLSIASGAKTEIQARSGNQDRPVKPSAGTSRWRILPGWNKDAPEKFFRQFGQHFIKGVDGKIVGSFVCEALSSEHEGTECQYCDAVQAMRRATKDDDALKKINEFRAGAVFLVNVLKIEGENASLTKPVLMAMPQSLMNAYLTSLAEYAKEGINLLDPKEGRNIIITREGSGFNTKYSMNPAPTSSAVDPAAMASLIDIDDYIERERVRGKGNLSKFGPTLQAVSRSVGVMAPVMIGSGTGSAEISGTRTITHDSDTTVGRVSSAAPESSTPSVPELADKGRVMDDELPWGDAKVEEKSSATTSDDLDDELQRQLQELGIA